MTSRELRQKFLDFFEKHGHRIVPSSSLQTADPTVLFTTAGMQQFKPYYLSEKSPYGENVATVQKCLRVSDIEEVGDERHLTFFEMLGSFSFGGYFKEEAIKLAKEFLDELNIKIDYVTVFEGDENTPRDEESAKIWEKLGFSKENGNLRFENKIENFWGPTGGEGPCGPTTEIYSDGIEIWNIVFNQYYSKNGKLEPLKTPGIDTGMGLERLAKVLQKKETLFDTDVFLPIIEEIEELSSLKHLGNERLYRVVADHIKAASFLLSDGIMPSNLGQGYILRRLIRRQIRSSHALTMKNDYRQFVDVIEKIYANIYPEITDKKEFIIAELEREFNKFILTLKNGLKEFEKGTDPFVLFTTYGFPIELTLELAREKNRKVDLEDFRKKMAEHQKLSQTASAGMFKGGLADTSEKTTKLHTAAHLMLAGLRKVLGEHVVQKGSNITAERLRFDFLHKEKMSSGQIKDVENFVNGIIEKDLPVWFKEMDLEKAKEMNAMGVFESKYGEKVKVYFIGKGEENVSCEICGGPHVDRTGILGRFKIMKEESSSSGVRRIKAVLE